MKAVTYTKYGPPDVLAIKEVPTPTPVDNEVLIRVRATTVNRTDCGYLRAKPFIIRFFSGITKPKRPILGNEFAGQVEAVGGGVSSFRVGDRVFGYNEGGAGSHAEYTVMPETGLVTTMPPNVTFEEAAPCTEGAHYALSFIKADKDSARAPRPRERCDGCHRVGSRPALEALRRRGDGGLRSQERGPGAVSRRRRGHRLPTRGLYEDRPTV